MKWCFYLLKGNTAEINGIICKSRQDWIKIY